MGATGHTTPKRTKYPNCCAISAYSPKMTALWQRGRSVSDRARGEEGPRREGDARRQELLLANALEEVPLVVVLLDRLLLVLLADGRRVVELLLDLGEELCLEVGDADLDEGARDLGRERVGDELRVELGRVDAERARLERRRGRLAKGGGVTRREAAEDVRHEERAERDLQGERVLVSSSTSRTGRGARGKRGRT